MERLSCGNCGHQTFFMYEDDDRLVAKCQGCHSTTVITISEPKLSLEFGEESQGILCKLKEKQ